MNDTVTNSLQEWIDTHIGNAFDWADATARHETGYGLSAIIAARVVQAAGAPNEIVRAALEWVHSEPLQTDAAAQIIAHARSRQRQGPQDLRDGASRLTDEAADVIKALNLTALPRFERVYAEVMSERSASKTGDTVAGAVI